MKQFDIRTPDAAIRTQLQDQLDQKTKPPGSLGQLEALAVQLGWIQQRLNPTIEAPKLIVFAGDHGVATEGVVNPYPQSVTAQMVHNFLDGGAAINVFARLHHLDLRIVNAGIKAKLPVHPMLIDCPVGPGTANYRLSPAMTEAQCWEAISNGANVVARITQDGCTSIGLGEMGIGNSSAAALLLHWITEEPLANCVGSGTGLDQAGIQRKTNVLMEVLQRHSRPTTAVAALATFGGFEIAMLVGAILQAAQQALVIVVDGFIVTAAVLIAHRLYPEVLAYCVFAHTSAERGHQLALDYLQATPLLHLQLRLGEGTGAALAFPLLRTATAVLREMTNFTDAGISHSTNP